MIQKRQQDDFATKWQAWIKATASFIFLGILAFIGNWGVSLSSSMAKLNDEVLVLKEKEEMMQNMIYPELLKETRLLRDEIKELRREIRR